MKLKDILAGTCLIILISGGIAYLVYDQLIEQSAPEEQSVGVPVELPTLEQTYKNELLGFGLDYPDNYVLIEETMEDYSWLRETRTNELLLVLEALESKQQPRLILYVNKEIPATRADRTLTLLQDNNGLYLTEVFEDQTRHEEQIRTFGSIVMSDNNVYTWEFVFGRGKYDYGSDLEAILSSFGIYETEEDETEETAPVDEEQLLR